MGTHKNGPGQDVSFVILYYGLLVTLFYP